MKKLATIILAIVLVSCELPTDNYEFGRYYGQWLGRNNEIGLQLNIQHYVYKNSHEISGNGTLLWYGEWEVEIANPVITPDGLITFQLVLRDVLENGGDYVFQCESQNYDNHKFDLWIGPGIDTILHMEPGKWAR